MLALRDAAKSKRNANGMIVMDFWSIVCGIYIWEFFTTLDYEWSVIRGHRQYRWTIWIYSFTRLSCLTIVVLTMAEFSIRSEINCQAWITAGWVLGTIGCNVLSTILLILRISAIWDKNKVILAICAVVCVSTFGFQFSNIVRVRSVWSAATGACTNLDMKVLKAQCVAVLVTDIALLLLMLAGLLLLRLRDGAFVNLAYVLWKQGLIWLALATAAELPEVVLLYLNLDDTLNSLFLIPALITTVIAATRTYRDLTYHAASTAPYSTGPLADSSNLPKSNRLVSSTENSSIVQIPSNRLEVTVQRTYEEYQMSQMDCCGSYPGSDARLANKLPHELGFDDNVEGRGEKK